MKMEIPKESLKQFIWKKNDEAESFVGIIRNIIKEEFKLLETNIKELINSNLNKTNEPLGGLDKLSSEVGDFTASSEFKLKRLARKLLQVKKETKDMKADIKAMEDDLSNSVKLPSILIELEDRYQRIIDGITEDLD